MCCGQDSGGENDLVISTSAQYENDHVIESENWERLGSRDEAWERYYV
jgi:hypothetical protein